MLLFYKKNQKLINMFLGGTFILVNLVIAYQFRTEGIKLKSINLIKKTHYQVAKSLSHNLENDCDLFSNAKMLTSIRKKLNEKGLVIDLNKTKVITISDLLFEKIVFRTMNKEEADESHLTYGYLVTHKSSKKCFGIL